VATLVRRDGEADREGREGKTGQTGGARWGGG
jgi:hypothetical protein